MTDTPAQPDESTPIVQALKGESIVDWVKNNDIKPFRYQPNNTGLWVLIVGGVITAAMAIWLYQRSALALPIHFAGFAVLIAATFWQWLIVIRWYGRLVGSYVLLSETEMLVGAGKSAWLVQRTRLTRDHVFVDAMQRGRITMVLPLRIDDWSYDIHLVGPFMNMKELQPFVAEMVSQLMVDEESPTPDQTSAGEASGRKGTSARSKTSTSKTSKKAKRGARS